jgi:hypothetical protein
MSNLLHTIGFYSLSKVVFILLTGCALFLSLYFKLSGTSLYILFGTLFVLYMATEYYVVTTLDKKYDAGIATYMSLLPSHFTS